MTTWNYRIVRHHRPEEWLGLHEVYYDEDGKPNALTAEPISFSCDPDEGPGGIIGSLEMALTDAKERPVLDRIEIGDDEPAFDERMTANASLSAAIEARAMDGFCDLWRKHQITTPELHREALARCEQLMKAEVGTVDGIQLMALAILVEAYESKVFRPSNQRGEN